MMRYRFEGVNHHGVTIAGTSEADLTELVENYFQRGWQSLSVTITKTEVEFSRSADGRGSLTSSTTEVELAGIGEVDGKRTWWVNRQTAWPG
jgi:predicted dithiol-disulfide oxidoreductase (DUF899 family)